MEGYVEHTGSFELHPLKHPGEQRSYVLFQGSDWFELPSLEPLSARLPRPLQRVIPWEMDLLFPLTYLLSLLNNSQLHPRWHNGLDQCPRKIPRSYDSGHKKSSESPLYNRLIFQEMRQASYAQSWTLTR
jgi:hypothetical protein